MKDVNSRSFQLLTLFTLVCFHIMICLSVLHSLLTPGPNTSGFSCAFARVHPESRVHAKLLRKTRKTTNDLPLSFPEELHEYWGTKMHLPAGVG